jgi:hypothetical protein
VQYIIFYNIILKLEKDDKKPGSIPGNTLPPVNTAQNNLQITINVQLKAASLDCFRQTLQPQCPGVGYGGKRLWPPLISESMEARYLAILLLFSSRCTCESISTATWSAPTVAASLTHLTGVMIS